MSKFEVEVITVVGQQHCPEAFPQVICSRNDRADLPSTLDWIGANRDDLLAQLNHHGAVLLRGFPVQTDQHFDALIQAFDLPNFTYAESLSNAVRRNRTPRVFTANEAPPTVSIYLHHEMAQTPLYPSRLFFYCEHAAASGGQTPLCRSDQLLNALGQRLPDFVTSCAKLGLRYTNVMPETEDPESGQGRSWHSTLSAPDRDAAEARLAKLGYQWEWLPDNSLRATTPILTAVMSLADGRRVFFNQLIAAFRGWKDRRNDPRKSVCFGNGSPLLDTDMQIAIQLADELTFDLAWKTGDVALVDNFLVMHGRRPYTGERRVLASLIR